MSLTIYKYPLRPAPEITHAALPEGAVFLHAAYQEHELFMWCMVDPDAPVEARQFAVVGTGWPLKDQAGLQYRGTVHHSGYVWHVLEVPPS